MRKSFFTFLIVAVTGFMPLVVSAANESTVLNCNKNSASPASAGSQVPLGGPYVPVADYAVELNTGLLVYKECVLRQIVTNQRKAVLVKTDERVLIKYNSGEGGNPTFGGFPSRELGKEEVALSIRTVARIVDNGSLSGFNDAIEGKVKNAVSQGYLNARDPRLSFRCPYTGDLEATYRGLPAGSFWDGYKAVFYNPACDVLRASVLGANAIGNQDAYELYKNRSRLDWGDGVYDLAHYDEDGFRFTDTPGRDVAATAENSILSGYRQQQEADDVGEMVDTLYSGITAQILTAGTAGSGTSGGGIGGLAAITSALSGAASYMGALIQSAGGTVATDINNQASGVLAAARTLEKEYNDAMKDLTKVFSGAQTTLVDTELQCYNSIAYAVCKTGTYQSTNSTCEAQSGAALNIVKKNKFSVAAYGTFKDYIIATAVNLGISDTKLAQIDDLIKRLNNGQITAAAAQAELTGTIKPHNASDRDAARNLKQTYTTLVNGADDDWQAASGWCNTSSQSVKDSWVACWSANSASCPDN